MKKKIISIIFGLLLVFNFTRDVEASCSNKPFLGCTSGTIACGNGSTCCTTSGECGQYPGQGPSNAGCTQVASNQTTCSGTQVACIQPLPGGGRIYRWCCNGQTSCDDIKEVVQQQITGQMAQPITSVSELCGNGINTAIGCIPVLADDNGVSFMGFVLRWAVGIGGGIAFVLILYGGFMVMTSQGNPERVKAGQELITSAVSGLVLLILSIFLLKFIGVDILGLDAFGFNH